ncbi:cytochrome b/b6 domain-containing protein [Brevibacterium antiquum]|uniref:Thiosulfate reductase cytochrome b subunit n=1 Tax=Brevibacterium antiquum TaxID=234835 RepID=A0A2H1J012_9MICO|nr:cytochrome b/b6 domain-containing protein [Brevibacterium antiquum]SMX80728.1 Thiosulfate reductase cytochrome b subunit [Brevibacterium antiquum]
MATYSSSLRSGLPRVPGGEPWPPEGIIGEPLEPGASVVPEESFEPEGSAAPDESSESESTDSGAEVDDSVETGQSAAVEQTVEGEEPADEPGSVGAGAAVGAAGVAVGAAAGTAAVASDSEAEPDETQEQSSDSVAEASSEVPLRRGLPRVEGGDPWPPEGLAPAGVKAPSNTSAASAVSGSGAAPAAPDVAPAVSDAQREPEAQSDSEPSAAPAADAPAADAPVAAAATAGAGAAAGTAAVASASGGQSAAEVPLRRGLPRVAGGDPWPPEGFAPAGAKAASSSSAPSSAPAAETSADAGVASGDEAPTADVAAAEADTSSAAPAAAATAGAAGAAVAASGKKSSGELSDTPLRRGLPRVVGGDPWPPEGFAPASATATSASTGGDASGAGSADTTSTGAAPTSAATAADSAAPAEKPSAGTSAQADSDSSSAAPAAAAGAAAVGAGAAGGAAASSSAGEKPAATSAEEKPARSGSPKSTGPAQRKPMAKPAAKATDKPTAKPAAKQADKPAAKSSSAPAKSTSASAAAKPDGAKKKEPTMIGSKSLGQWAKLGGLGLGGLVVVAGILVLAARGLTTLPGVPEFLERYPGEYHLPEFVDDGFPAWARWTHFLNVFFMVLIIRSGLQVRHQQKPPAFYTPKKGGKKISINLWFHTGIDLLWLANGVIFVVLLFISGHWARIVPTSWEVFPNAVSAMLQYAMLDWPAEDGWVNYNSLQQLMYFIVVFIAAPLAAITGVRMSEWWPKNATKLNKIYPAPLARAIHFPTMIFFVVFILIHVFLVFATGMRQNLNHMYAGSDDLNWIGFIWFVASLAVIAGGWFAARPMLLAPIANMFGRVSSR